MTTIVEVKEIKKKMLFGITSSLLYISPYFSSGCCLLYELPSQMAIQQKTTIIETVKRPTSRLDICLHLYVLTNTKGTNVLPTR